MKKILFILLLFGTCVCYGQISSVVAVAAGNNPRLGFDSPITLSNDVDPLDRYILLSYSTSVFSNSDNGGVKLSDYTITFAANGGTATAALISSVANSTNGALVGGEFVVRVNLIVTGTVAGTETITLAPASDLAIISEHIGRASISSNTTVSRLFKTLDSDYGTLLTYHLGNAGTVPPYKYRNVENQWVLDIKAANSWSILDRLWRFSKYGDRAYSLLDWKNPGSNTLTIGGTMPWAYGTGYTYGSGYFLTGFIPSTSGVNFVQNNAAVFHVNEVDVSSNSQFDYGVANAANTSVVSLNSRTAGGSIVATIALNSAQGSTVATVTTSATDFLNNRTGSANTTHKFYVGGTLFDATNFVSVALPDQELVIGARRNNNATISGLTTRKVSLLMLGSSMATNVSSMHTAEGTFTTALAAVTYATQLQTDGGTSLQTDTPTNLTSD